MTRDEWIQQCAARFRAAGSSEFAAKDLAISEFYIRCQEEPLEGSPHLPADRWPDPADAAEDAMSQWGSDE